MDAGRTKGLAKSQCTTISVDLNGIVGNKGAKNNNVSLKVISKSLQNEAWVLCYNYKKKKKKKCQTFRAQLTALFSSLPVTVTTSHPAPLYKKKKSSCHIPLFDSSESMGGEKERDRDGWIRSGACGRRGDALMAVRVNPIEKRSLSHYS